MPGPWLGLALCMLAVGTAARPREGPGRAAPGSGRPLDDAPQPEVLLQEASGGAHKPRRVAFVTSEGASSVAFAGGESQGYGELRPASCLLHRRPRHLLHRRSTC